MTKQELRKIASEKIRQFIKTGEAESASEKICGHIINSPEFKNSRTILAYMPLFDEPDISPLIGAAAADGKRTAVPRIVPGTNLMNFFYIDDLDRQTERGSFGILEPSEKLEEFKCENSGGGILVLVPGRAFSAAGERLGRGKGFYDRFLKGLYGRNSAPEKIFTVGVCFDIQLSDSVPTEKSDMGVQRVCTESGFLTENNCYCVYSGVSL